MNLFLRELIDRFKTAHQQNPETCAGIVSVDIPRAWWTYWTPLETDIVKNLYMIQWQDYDQCDSQSALNSFVVGIISNNSGAYRCVPTKQVELPDSVVIPAEQVYARFGDVDYRNESGFYLTGSTASPAHLALYDGAFITSKIEYVIPQLGTRGTAQATITSRQTMPHAEMAQVRTARFHVNDARDLFVENAEQTAG